MHRLPPFFSRISPVGETLMSLLRGQQRLQAETDSRNDQLCPSTATSGLSLWEADHSLPRTGSTDDRRTRILTALAGIQTLTPAHLKSLAVTMGNADRGEVEEDFPRWAVTLSAVYENRVPEDTAPLEAAAARLKPAHLHLDVVPVAQLRQNSVRYLAHSAGVFVCIPCRNAPQ